MKIHVGFRKAPPSSGREYYIYLRYYDGKKHRYLDRELYPNFKNPSEAKEWIKKDESLKEIYEKLDVVGKLNSKIPTEKLEKSRKEVEWKKRFFDHYQDFQAYINEMKKPGRAPNSWEATRAYLEYYVFYFFLLDKNEGNYVHWHKRFPEFVKWLEDEAISSKTGNPLSYSTRNACIKTLNSFLKYIGFQKFSNQQPLLLIRCPSFANELLKQNQRTYKDIILEDEFISIQRQLDINKKDSEEFSKTGEFANLLYRTGMRFQELYTITLDSVIDKPEKLPHFMTEIYTRVGRPIYGYLLLKSQSLHKIRNKSRITEEMKKNKKINQEAGCLLRKPLKSKKVIAPKNNRLIPIWDEEAWNIIKRNQAISTEKLLNQYHGSHAKKEDYYLLDDVEANQLRNELRAVTKKSYHANRHSFITLNTGFLMSKNILPELVLRPITGISSKVIESYNHTYEELMLAAAG